MKIALYSSPVHTVPPNEKNILAPWELVHDLANGLVERGHTVLLFAPKGSKTKATLFHGDIDPVIREKPKYLNDLEQYRALVAARSLALFRYMISVIRENPVDVVHAHQSMEMFLPAFADFPHSIGVAATFHDAVDGSRWPALEKVAAYDNVHFVGISRAQFRDTPFTPVAVVPNGIDPSLFEVVDESSSNDHPLLMVGRIVPEKGFVDGIMAAKRSHIRLMIVGQKYEEIPVAKEYFDTQIIPHIDGKTLIWEPVVKRDHLLGHYQTARALLFPIGWEEPFGLVMTEAMACGTPVIAYNRGSVPEVIQDGVTGFIVDPDNVERPNKGNWIIKKQGVDGLVEAIQRIGEIDRRACRELVEQKFTVDHMINGYVSVYEKISQEGIT